MTERAFQRLVLELAALFGWRVAHFRPARTARGWRTAVQAQGAGWPDLVLCNGTRVLFRELKTDDGKVSLNQRAWLRALADAGCDARVWRPRDIEEIERTLAG